MVLLAHCRSLERCTWSLNGILNIIKMYPKVQMELVWAPKYIENRVIIRSMFNQCFKATKQLLLKIETVVSKK